MTFKDLMRLVRRRWLVALLGAAVVMGFFWVLVQVKEQPLFKARTRVYLSTPPLLVTAAQGTQWISVHQVDPKTWISTIQSRRIRSAALARLQKMRPEYAAPDGIRQEWLATIAAVPEVGEQLVWVEAVAPTVRIATDIANAAAEAAEVDSREMANQQLEEARKKAKENVDEEAAKIREMEQKAAQVRDRARASHGSDNLEFDVRKTHEEVLGYESRRRDLERRASANRLKLERVRQDRAAAEHLLREAVPRTAPVQVRISESGPVRALVERLESLHRELNASRRKYTDEHPAVKAARNEIREAQVELSRAQALALGRDIDAEELGLLSDSEMIRIELRVLDPDQKDLAARLALLSPLLADVQKREREIADAKARLAPLDVQRTQLLAAPAAMGYVQIRDRAETADATPIEMKLRKSWLIALLAAVIVGFSFAFLVDFLDTSIRNDHDVRRHLDFPVLAVVPRVASDEVLTVASARTGIVSEIYDTLATVLLSAPSAQPSRILLVTSTNAQEGKTAVSTNLAVALARQGKRTLLVDGDMRLPAVHAALGLANATGLSDVLAGLVQPDTPGVIQDVSVPNLSVLTSGATPENPYELLDPARIAPVGAMLRGQYEAIVLDTPPVLQAGDALKYSSLADAVLFVIKVGATDVRQATWAKRLLANVNAKVAGVVLNGALRDSGEYDPYYRYSRSSRSSF